MYGASAGPAPCAMMQPHAHTQGDCSEDAAAEATPTDLLIAGADQPRSRAAAAAPPCPPCPIARCSTRCLSPRHASCSPRSTAGSPPPAAAGPARRPTGGEGSGQGRWTRGSAAHQPCCTPYGATPVARRAREATARLHDCPAPALSHARAHAPYACVCSNGSDPAAALQALDLAPQSCHAKHLRMLEARRRLFRHSCSWCWPLR